MTTQHTSKTNSNHSRHHSNNSTSNTKRTAHSQQDSNLLHTDSHPPPLLLTGGRQPLHASSPSSRRTYAPMASSSSKRSSQSKSVVAVTNTIQKYFKPNGNDSNKNSTTTPADDTSSKSKSSSNTRHISTGRSHQRSSSAAEERKEKESTARSNRGSHTQTSKKRSRSSSSESEENDSEEEEEDDEGEERKSNKPKSAPSKSRGSAAASSSSKSHSKSSTAASASSSSHKSTTSPLAHKSVASGDEEDEESSGLKKLPGFNGNQYRDKYGRLRQPDGSAVKGTTANKRQKSSHPKATSSFTESTSDVDDEPPVPPSSLGSLKSQLPLVALSPFKNSAHSSRRSPHASFFQFTAATNNAASSAAFDRVLNSSPVHTNSKHTHTPSAAAASSMTAAAAAVTSSSSSSASSSVAAQLPPHPQHSSLPSLMYRGRTGTGVSNVSTPRKRVVRSDDQDDAPKAEVHFRRRFKKLELPSAVKRKLKPLADDGTSTAASSTTPSNNQSSSSTSSTSRRLNNLGSPTKSRKSSKAPYKELARAHRDAHRCTQPAGADWIWQSLQHRSVFSSIDTYQAAMDESNDDSAATSSSSKDVPDAPHTFSPFAATLPTSQSSIAPFLVHQDCDPDTLRLYTGLRSFVRYHRVRGLVVPSTSTKKRARASNETIHDPILKALHEIHESKNTNDEEDENDEEEEEDSNNRSSAAAASSSSSSSSHRTSSSSPLLRLLNNTRLIPSSLAMPSKFLDDNFFTIPLSTQLIHAKYHASSPAAWSEVVHLKGKDFLSFEFAPTSTIKAKQININDEEEWLGTCEGELPEPHRPLVRLFYSHVKPTHSSGASSPSVSASSSTSSPSHSSLDDHQYHFNLTLFAGALLHHLYRREDLVMFIAPVDPSRDRLAMYHRELIKNPLSLHDIDMRVVCGYYDTVLELLSDLWRCFENTQMFHMKPVHRRRNETKLECEERSANETPFARNMTEKVHKMWHDVRNFVEKYYHTFMTYQPGSTNTSSSSSNPNTSPRVLSANVHSTLDELRTWMSEVVSREVQTLKYIWIARREIETLKKRTPMQPISRWKQFSRHAPPSTTNDAAEGTSENDNDAADEEDSRARKHQKQSQSKSLRPTRAHPISGLPLNHPAPHDAWPPLFHSRSEGPRHARNMPLAIIRKLGRRAGKIPLTWEKRWFYMAKCQ